MVPGGGLQAGEVHRVANAVPGMDVRQRLFVKKARNARRKGRSRLAGSDACVVRVAVGAGRIVLAGATYGQVQTLARHVQEGHAGRAIRLAVTGVGNLAVAGGIEEQVVTGILAASAVMGVGRARLHGVGQAPREEAVHTPGGTVAIGIVPTSADPGRGHGGGPASGFSQAEVHGAREAVGPLRHAGGAKHHIDAVNAVGRQQGRILVGTTAIHGVVHAHAVEQQEGLLARQAAQVGAGLVARRALHEHARGVGQGVHSLEAGFTLVGVAFDPVDRVGLLDRILVDAGDADGQGGGGILGGHGGSEEEQGRGADHGDPS